jgi:hypothetical protein
MHIQGLQVTEIRFNQYSELHNCFGAVCNGQLTAMVWTDIFGNCGSNIEFWELLDLSWMHRKHIQGLQVTEIRSIQYSEFHNCFGAVRNGLN